MSKFTRILKVAALPGLCLIASPALAQAKYQANSNNGACFFTVQGPNAPDTDKPMSLEFSYRVRDGNMGVKIMVNGWPKAQAADPDVKVPATVVFDNGRTKPSRSGGYDSGFNDSFWAGWGPGELSTPLFDLLKEARAARVEADGAIFGYFNLQGKGTAHRELSNCIERVKAGEEYTSP